MITDGASSTCMDNSDEIDGEEAIDEEDVVVSSRALETVMEKSRALETVMKEFERDIEEHLKLAIMKLENQYYHHLQQMRQ